MQTAKMMLSGLGWVDMAGLGLTSKAYIYNMYLSIYYRYE